MIDDDFLLSEVECKWGWMLCIIVLFHEWNQYCRFEIFASNFKYKHWLTSSAQDRHLVMDACM